MTPSTNVVINRSVSIRNENTKRNSLYDENQEKIRKK